MSIDDYDIRNYTDTQLYNILDINNPTDRELEAKIVTMIRQFSLMNNTTGKKMVQFFTDIYNHFFDENNDDISVEDSNYSTDNRLLEGMTTDQSQGLPNAITGDVNTTGATFVSETSKDISTRQEGAGKVGQVTQVEYTRGTVNPLLRNTVKRVISIDSQYRENKSGLSTEYTFNLSEPLQNVVAVRLYSVQIPYTWYTINNNFGGNFFYIKGNSQGINNETFQYKVEVPSGNYSPTELVTAINTSITNLKNTVTDISFGTTNISYNSNNSLATITLDINNSYNENGYILEFEEWTSPNNLDSDQQYLRYKENSTLPAFLGYNYISYQANIIYSTRTLPLYSTNDTVDNTARLYTLDELNNYIYIKQYTGSTYSPGNVVNTITITLPIDFNNRIKTRNELVTLLNTALSSSPYLTNSYIERVNITDVSNLTDASDQKVINSGFSQFKLHITLNRSTTSNQRGLRTVVIFPDESTFNRNHIWLQSNIRESCFSFKTIINELNDIRAETQLFESNYLFTSKPYIELQCIKPGFQSYEGNVTHSSFTGNSTISYNDYRIYVDPPPPGSVGYSLSNYLSAINTSFAITNTSSIDENNLNGVFAQSSGVLNDQTTFNKVRFRFDMTKSFPINNFILNYGSVFTGQGFTGDNITLGSSNKVFISSLQTTTSFNIYTGSVFFVISPNRGVGNLHTQSWSVQYNGGNLFAQTISNYVSTVATTINNYIDIYGNKPLVGTTFTYSQIQDVTPFTYNFVLSLNVSVTLTQTDYKAIFYDPSAGPAGWSTTSSNSWNNLLIGQKEYSLLTNAVLNTTYSDIYGTGTLTGYTFSLRNNTYFTLRALTNGISTSNGAYDIRINIPASTTNNNTYTRGEVFDIINNAFSANPLTVGSQIYQYIDNNNVSYVSMRIIINKTFTTQDYRLVFYDPYSFATCTAGVTSIRNATWDSTLGWILGFRKYTEYLIPTSNDNTIVVNSSTNITTITGSVTVTTQLYNYFMIILDDYTQSHLNDGLITITPQEQDITAPSYAPKSSYQCDPSTGDIVFSGTTDNSQGALTARQIYSANQILSAKNAKRITSYSRGPFVKDVFGIIPIKTAGLANGSYYVEFGGTLQNQERIYFGPVNLHRMTVKLVNDRGESVDLNGSNWSFSLVCEMLYNQTQGTNQNSL